MENKPKYTKEMRQSEATPLLEKLGEWMKKQYMQVSDGMRGSVYVVFPIKT